MFSALRVSLDLDLNERDQEGRTRISYREKLLSNRWDVHIQFLPQFTQCRIEIGFVPLNLATRKLPKPTVSLVEWPATDEEQIFMLDDGGKHSNQWISSQ